MIMRDQLRKQAQDRLTEGQTIFGPPRVSSFSQVFPQIEGLKIVATESGHEVNYGQNTQTYTGSVGEYIRCSNHFCNGGFKIAEVIRQMTKINEPHREDTLICGGSETSPKGRRVYKRCMNSLRVVVDIKYV
jgi:hypothetical protein